MANPPFDKMAGLAALAEISKRLGNIGEQVKDAILEGHAKTTAGQNSDSAHEQRFTINTPRGPVDGVSQMSFRVGSLSNRMPAGRGSRSASGSTVADRAEWTRKAAPDLDNAREPMIDCFDEGDALLITAELPGVAAADVEVKLEGNQLLVQTTGVRRYRARQILPHAVDASSLTHALRNGILEAHVKKSGSAS